MTIEAMLGLTEVRVGDPVVRAGHRSLGREIRWVHAAEVPNIASLLEGGELLLTTGMGLGKRERDQRRFVRGLAERHAAGFALELGQVFDDMPRGLIEEAEREDLPLIALRREVSFVKITEAVHRAILQRQYAFLERGTAVHDRFTQIVFGGGDLGEVMHALAQTVRNPVVLENGERELLCHAEFRAPEGEVLSAWRTIGHEDSGDSASSACVMPVPMRGRQDGRLIILPIDGDVSEFDRVVLERIAWILALNLLHRSEEEQASLRTRDAP